MKNGLVKLIEILPWLCANPGSSAKDTAENFGISQKELLDLLQLAVVTGPGQAGGELVDIDFEDEESLFVFDAKGLERPVQFSAETSIKIVGGLHLLLQLPGVVDTANLENLMVKLQSAFHIENQPIEIDVSERISQITSIIVNAIATRKCLHIEYAAINSNEISKRVVEPKKLITNNNSVHLKAWCCAALDFRLFRIDRINNIELLDRPQEDRNLVQDDVLMGPVEVTLDCINYIAAEFDSRIVKDLKQNANGRVELTIGIHDLGWIASEILASNGKIRAIAPVELVKLVSDRVAIWQELNTSA